MEKIVKLTMTIVLSIVSLGQVCAFEQQKIAGLTDYQNKRLELVNEAFEAISNTLNDADQAALAYALVSWIQKNADEYKIGQNDPLGELELLEGFLAQTCGMAPWLIGGESTTLHEDITLSKYTYICQNYRNARQALDDDTPRLDLVEEQRIQTARAQMRASTFQLEKSLQKALAKWMEKGQVEKSADYQARLKMKSTYAFDSICSRLLSDQQVFGNLRQKLGNYDADTEEYTVEFYYQDKNYSKIHSVRGHFYLPPSEINEVDRILYSAYSSPTGVELQKIDGYIYPKRIMWSRSLYDITNNEKPQLDIIIHVDVPNAEDVSFDFARLGIQNEYLKGYTRKASTMQHGIEYAKMVHYIDSCNHQLWRHSPILLQYTLKCELSYGDSKFDYEHIFEKVYNEVSQLMELSDYVVKVATAINYKLENEGADARNDHGYNRHSLQEWYKTLQKLPQEIVYKKFDVRYDLFRGEYRLLDCQRVLIYRYKTWKRYKDVDIKEVQDLRAQVCHDYISNNIDGKVLKEYQKNSQYFNSEVDFIDAYLFSADYPDYQSAINGKSYKEELKKRKSAK